MALDTHTLFLVTVCTVAALALSLVVTLGPRLSEDHWPGLRAWTLGMVLVAAGWTVRLFVPALSPAVAAAAGLGLVSLGFGWMWRAMRRFHGRPAPVLAALAPALLVAAQQLAWFDDERARVVFVNAVFALQLLAVMAATLPAPGMTGVRARWLLSGALLALAASLAVRGALAAFVTDAPIDVTSSHPANAISVLASVVIGLLMNFALLALYLERVTAQQRAVAESDPLTGALNRRALNQVAARAIEHARSSARPLALLMVDIDHFKLVNDRHGHLAGDRVLDAVCTAIRAQLRGGDTLTRFGGDELLLLLPDTALDNAADVAERIRTRLRHHAWPIEALEVTLTVGVAAWRQGEPTLDAAIARADAALYRAKQDGRDRVALAPAHG